MIVDDVGYELGILEELGAYLQALVDALSA